MAPPIHELRPSLEISDKPLPKSFVTSLPSPTLTVTSPVPAWKRPSNWITRQRSRLYLALTAVVLLQLLTLIILVG